MDVDAFEKKFNTLEVDFIRSQQLFCQDVLKLLPGQRAVISNGRVSPLKHHLKRSFTQYSNCEFDPIEIYNIDKSKSRFCILYWKTVCISCCS